jgi:hypothetical protein
MPVVPPKKILIKKIIVIHSLIETPGAFLLKTVAS